MSLILSCSFCFQPCITSASFNAAPSNLPGLIVLCLWIHHQQCLLHNMLLRLYLQIISSHIFFNTLIIILLYILNKSREKIILVILPCLFLHSLNSICYSKYSLHPFCVDQVFSFVCVVLYQMSLHLWKKYKSSCISIVHSYNAKCISYSIILNKIKFTSSTHKSYH